MNLNFEEFVSELSVVYELLFGLKPTHLYLPLLCFFCILASFFFYSVERPHSTFASFSSDEHRVFRGTIVFSPTRQRLYLSKGHAHTLCFQHRCCCAFAGATCFERPVLLQRLGLAVRRDSK